MRRQVEIKDYNTELVAILVRIGARVLPFCIRGFTVACALWCIGALQIGRSVSTLNSPYRSYGC